MSGPDLDLTGFEWDVRQRAAEAIVRGDTPDARDLEWLAEGYLKLIELADDADSYICELERDLEKAGDLELLAWRSNGKQADQLIHVPITQEIYAALLVRSTQIAALSEQDDDTSVAVTVFSALASWADLQKSLRAAQEAAQALHKAVQPTVAPPPRAKRNKKQ